MELITIFMFNQLKQKTNIELKYVEIAEIYEKVVKAGLLVKHTHGNSIEYFP